VERKELIAVLLLGLLVAVGATVRLFSTPLPNSSDRRTARVPRFGAPRGPNSSAPPGGGFGAGTWRPRVDGFPPRDPGARSLFDAAEVIYGNGLFGAAVPTYEHFLKEYPSDPAGEIALLRVAQCYTLLKRDDEAAKHYELFLQRYPQAELRPLALLWSGNSHLLTGDTKMARQRFAEVIAQFPATPFAEPAKAHLDRLEAESAKAPSGAPATRTPQPE